MRTRLSRKSGGSIQAAAMVLFLTICLSISGAWANNDGMQPDKSLSFAEKAEIRFMTKMIDHHASAVEMAQMCEAKAEHDELLSLCGEMKQAQLEEIDQMQDWLDDWYHVQHEPKISISDRAMMFRLARLSGAEFEVSFMENMIMHHRGALLMVMEYYPKVFHEELLHMMEDILVAQISEIRLLQGWLCDWYGLCD